MEIGIEFVLGFMLGQWVTLFVVWRAAIRLAELDARYNSQDTDKPERHTMIIDLDEEDDRRSRF